MHVFPASSPALGPVAQWSLSASAYGKLGDLQVELRVLDCAP